MHRYMTLARRVMPALGQQWRVIDVTEFMSAFELRAHETA